MTPYSFWTFLKKGWGAVTHSINLVFSTILLTLLWFLGIGLYAVIFKTFGIFHKNNQSTTYWISTSEKGRDDLQHPF